MSLEERTSQKTQPYTLPKSPIPSMKTTCRTIIISVLRVPPRERTSQETEHDLLSYNSHVILYTSQETQPFVLCRSNSRDYMNHVLTYESYYHINQINYHIPVKKHSLLSLVTLIL